MNSIEFKNHIFNKNNNNLNMKETLRINNLILGSHEVSEREKCGLQL